MNTMLCEASGCTRTASDDARVCTVCHRELRAALAELPRIYDDCGAALLPRRNPTLQRVGGTRRPPGIVIDEDAIATRANVLGFLASWSALAADELGVSRPARRHAADLAAFLARHLRWLLAHPAVGDFAGELRQTVADARRSAYTRPALRMELGQCVHPGCDAALAPAPSEVRCSAGHTWQPHQWLHLFRQIQRSGDAV